MTLLVVSATLAQDQVTVPQAGPDQRLAGGNPAYLRIVRGGATGTVAVFGAELPGVNSDNYRRLIAGDSANVDTDMDFAAFANYNWIVKRNGVILKQAAAPGDLTEFNVTDNSGAARIVIGDGTPTPEGDTIEVYRVTPVAIQAAAATQFVVKNIRSYDVFWSVCSDTGSFSAGVVSIEPAVN